MTDSSLPIVRAAAAGDSGGRQAFTRRYLPVVRAYLVARWRRSELLADTEDALQETFLECFRDGGALQTLDWQRAGRAGFDFRAYLLGVVRNVARRFEAQLATRRRKQTAPPDPLSQIPDDETALSQVFDRAWARNVMRQAGELQAALARHRGPDARERVELLRLRFQEGLPIREISQLWDVPAARLHHEFARAREEFRQALHQVVGEQEGYSAKRLDFECQRLLRMLQ